MGGKQLSKCKTGYKCFEEKYNLIRGERVIWKYSLDRVIRENSDSIVVVNGQPPTDSLLGEQRKKSSNQFISEKKTN